MLIDQQQPEELDQQTRELIAATASDKQRINALIRGQVGSPDYPSITNWKGNAIDGYRMEQKCLGFQCHEGKMHLGQPIDMAYYYVTVIEQLHEESGEMRPAVYVAIVDTDGKAYGFWSAFVARDLGRLVSKLGDPSPDMPHKVRVVECVRQGKMRSWYSLELV